MLPEIRENRFGFLVAGLAITDDSMTHGFNVPFSAVSRSSRFRWFVAVSLECFCHNLDVWFCYDPLTKIWISFSKTLFGFACERDLECHVASSACPRPVGSLHTHEMKYMFQVMEGF